MSDEVMGLLNTILEGTGPEVDRALDTIRSLRGDPRLWPLLESLIEVTKDRHNLSIIPNAIYAIGEIGDKGVVPVLLEILKQGSSREDARHALQELRTMGPLMISRQTSEFNTVIPQIREAAAIALGILGDKRAVRPLMDTLQQDWAWNVQAAAAFALGELGEEEAIPLLKAVSKSGEEEVQEQANIALKKLKKKTGLFGIFANQKR